MLGSPLGLNRGEVIEMFEILFTPPAGKGRRKPKKAGERRSVKAARRSLKSSKEGTKRKGASKRPGVSAAKSSLAKR